MDRVLDDRSHGIALPCRADLLQRMAARGVEAEARANMWRPAPRAAQASDMRRILVLEVAVRTLTDRSAHSLNASRACSIWAFLASAPHVQGAGCPVMSS